MNIRIGLGLFLAGWAWGGGCMAQARDLDAVRDAIVKIYPINNYPDYFNPWSMRGPSGGTGSGFIIEGNRILSNGHVVGYETFIQVRRHGDAKRYQARVLSVDHTADLALLTVDDPAFFDGVTPIELGEMPDPQDEVLVYGFPLGGDSMSITKGVISRIEHQVYAHSGVSLLAGQIDAAINPGNSGGPVVRDGALVGVVMQGLQQADNIGYMVPVNIVRHMLADIEDGKVDGFPSLGVAMQNIENPDLKSRFAVPEDRNGVLVTRIVPGSPASGALQPRDVLLSLDGYEIAEDGTIEFRPQQRTSLSYAIQRKQVGESLDLEVLREGVPTNLTVALTRPMNADWLVPLDQYDVLPTYYIYAGAVFVPLTKNLLKAWGNNWYRNAPLELVSILQDNLPEEEGQEVVMILRFLPDDVNQGYHTMMYWLVESVNGADINRMQDLIVAIEGTEEPFVELTSPNGAVLVFDRTKAEAARDRILSTYRIPADRSPDLAP